MHLENTRQDQLLLNAVRLGDERALAKIYSKYWMKLLSTAIHRLSAETEAEECVQDVFIGIWRRRETLKEIENLEAYLSVATKNQILNRLAHRYTKKHNLKIPNTQDTAYETADAGLLAKDLSAMIEHTVSSLPEKCRMVYRMSRDHGKNNKVIAMELGISEKTVEGHLTKAIQTIRQRLSAHAGLPVMVILDWYINFHLKS